MLLAHRTDLDGAVFGDRDPCRDLDRVIEVVAVDQVVADEPIGRSEGRTVVLCTHEMTEDGAIHIALDTNDFDNSLMKGFQEFMPNWGDFLS